MADKTVKINIPVTFNDTSTNLDSSPTYTWDFGDGSNGTGKSVVHTYTSDKIYTVKHTSKNSCELTPQICTKTVEVIKDVIPKYKCSNNICIRDDSTGTFTDPSCNNTCSPQLTKILINPSSIQLMINQGINITATAYDQNNNVMPNTIINWSSPFDTLILSNLSTITDSQGKSFNYIVAKNIIGITNVKVENANVSSNIIVNVIESTSVKTLTKFEITANLNILKYGEKLDFYATAYDQNNDVMPNIVIMWTVNPSIATLTNTSSVTTVNGTSNNSIVAGNITGNVSLNASSGVVSDNIFISISPSSGISGATIAALSGFVLIIISSIKK